MNNTQDISAWATLIQACAPILLALLGIIPTVIKNRKKTQDSLTEMKKELKGDIKSTKDDVAALRKDFDKHMQDDEADKARQARTRILRFYDEVCEGRPHSESHFEDMLDDIDYYEAYCEEHKDFKNNRGKAAMEYIQEVYKKVKKEGGFLVHSSVN